MVSNDNADTLNDDLSKVHPLLNLLKLSMSRYLDLGSELALGEASVAC